MMNGTRIAMLVLSLIGGCSKAEESAKSEPSSVTKPVENAPVSAAPAAAPTAPAPTALPCDGPELVEFAKQLDTANGIGVDDLGSEAGQATIKAAGASIKGKRVAFKNCVFTSQGNDQVSFAARKDAPSDIDCKMAGGEVGNRAFRDAAMVLDPEKLRLDVTGVVASEGGEYELTDCTIKAHE